MSDSTMGPARTEYSYRKRHKVASYICSQGLRWDDSMLSICLELRINPTGWSPQRLIRRMSSIIVPSNVQMWGRSTTPSSSGSQVTSLVQKQIMKGLHQAKKDFVEMSPGVNCLPAPVFPSEPSSSSSPLEQGLRQMSEVITKMLDTALSDQEFQVPKKSAWKTLPVAGTATPEWREYEFNGEIHYSWPDEPLYP